MTNIKDKRRAVTRTAVAIVVTIAMTFSLMPFGGDSAQAAGSTAKDIGAKSALAKKSAAKKAAAKGIGVPRSMTKIAKAAGGKIVKKNGKKCFAFSATADFASDNIEETRGMVREFIDANYDYAVQDQSMYAPEVWKEIDDSLSKINGMIDGAKRVKDILVSDGLFLYLDEKIEEEFEIMMVLGTMIKHYVKSGKDIPKLVKQAKKDLNDVKKEAKKKYFNYFYWGRLQNLFTDAFDDLKKVKTLREYIMTVSGINEWIGDVGTSIADAQYAEIDTGEEEEEYYSEYAPEELLILLGESEEAEFIIVIFGEDEGYIKSNSEVEEARLLQVSRLKEFVQRDEKKTKEEKEKMDAAIDKFKKKTLDKIEDTDKIEEEGRKKIEEMMVKAGVKIHEVTPREFTDAAKQYNALTSNYSQIDYYASKWGLVEKAFFDTKEIIENAEYNYELYGLIPYLKSRADKVITLDKQFAKEKKKAQKRLKAYTKKSKRKKFNQKKIKKLIKLFNAKVKKIKDYDIDELLALAEKYLEKAETCINKYKITVKKKGKGYAGKSKKVEYGKSHTVRLKPAKGYKIKKVTIDGKKKKIKRKYTFKKVRKKHIVKVVFGKK